MNILILSASTGAGHMRASRALQSYILENSKEESQVKIVDTLEYINPLLNKTVTEGYVYLATKTPKLYGKIYDNTNKEHKLSSFVSKVNKLFSKKLTPLINDFKPDVIISTHPFPTEMVSILKESKKINMPLICIMTDYAPHNTWIHDEVDAYVVANDDMVDEMVDMGVKRQLIHPYGIPIDNVFFDRKDRIQLFKEFSLDSELPTILIMAGSFGVTNILNIYNAIVSLPIEFQVVVITGKNKSLYDHFEKAIKNNSKPTKLIYFTDEVNKYMQIADLIITKPGGLTVSEALACHIPMAIFNAIPGQEEENAEFLINHNMAVNLENGESCKDVIFDLLLNKEKLQNMRSSCESFNKSNSTKNICLLIDDILAKKKV